MPYIKREQRDEFSFSAVPETEGELNYCFTVLALAYLKDKKLSYRLINDVLGALEGAKQEFYRRVAIPYEDKKIVENGDVYDLKALLGEKEMIVEAMYRTLTCDSCGKNATFSAQEFQTPQGQKEIIEQIPWLRSYRVANNVYNGQTFGYCSDECEVKGIETGKHNHQDQKRVITLPSGNDLAAIKQAAAEAAARAEGERRLKAGEPVNITPAQS